MRALQVGSDAASPPWSSFPRCRRFESAAASIALERDWTRSRSDPRLGPRARLRRDRHRRHRSRRRRSAASGLARRRPARRRWIIWRATARAARGRRSSCPGRCASSPRAWTTCRRRARPSERGARRSARKAYVARYALGRDYHKVLRARCSGSPTASRDESRRRSAIACSPTARRCSRSSWRAKSGLGWRGKHTLLLTREAGSWFFLGEIYTDLPLPVDAPVSGALRHAAAPASTSARPARSSRRTSSTRGAASRTSRSSSKGSIPEELRPLIGNRIYGCDDCQLVCPWNRYAQRATGAGLRRAARPRRRRPRRALRVDRTTSSCARTEGSAIRRIGYERWLRNLAVGARQRAERCRRSSPRSRARATIRRRWCASTSPGRWRGTRSHADRHARQSPPAQVDTAISAALVVVAPPLAPTASADELVHRHDRQHDREHQHQHDRAHRDDQRRLHQRREPGEPPLGFALELAAPRAPASARAARSASPLATDG